MPVEWPADPSLEWCPPGHGDLYTALLTSGMLEALLDGGYRYAFVSNSDNLGAVLDPRILAWVARERLPFAMEVTERTEADRKGGHLARRGDRYVLRETAQTPKEDLDALQDISRHRYVNTNNLWVDLAALRDVLEERSGVLGLPLIVNQKNVDPGDKSTPEVFQLETAMGAAIGVFDGARAGGGAAAALLAGQDDRGPACAALGRLRARRGRAGRTGPGARRDAAGGRPRRRALQAAARLRRAVPGRALAGRVRRGWRSRAT